jgi:enterochelin esterase-like enzyme
MMPIEDLALPPRFKQRLQTALAHKTLDELWKDLKENGQIPMIEGQTAVFMYYGASDVTQVSVTGDFTSWSTNGMPMYQVADTGWWLATFDFPLDARVDYKLILNREMATLDPANRRTQVSGFGPNSVLAMPDYRPSPWTTPRVDIAAGQLTPVSHLSSKHISGGILYRVYVPASYEHLRDLPVIYVTDGHEFADDEMGAMRLVLDNLIAAEMIQPALSVFIDPRDPQDLSINRRRMLYVDNPAFNRLIIEELIPQVDQTYRTKRVRDSRTMLGTSLGGLHALDVGLSHPDKFANLGVQSPALNWGDVAERFIESPRLALKIFLSSGVDGWDTDASQFYAGLIDKGYAAQFVSVNEGHSWGAWREQLGDLLIYLLG